MGDESGHPCIIIIHITALSIYRTCIAYISLLYPCSVSFSMLVNFWKCDTSALAHENQLLAITNMSCADLDAIQAKFGRLYVPQKLTHSTASFTKRVAHWPLAAGQCILDTFRRGPFRDEECHDAVC